MPNHPKLSFNGGELSDLLDARTDLEKYDTGCRTMTNMLPRIHGPAMRRPGTKYVATSKTTGLKVRLVEFEYSTSVSYVMEFGNLYVRFYTSGAQLSSGGSPVELVTTYLTADLYDLQFKQSNDVVWITHPSYAPRKLTRTSATAFSLDEITFKGGPFRKRNDILNGDAITITPSATTGAGITLTASSATFTSDHVGAFFAITQPRVNTIVDGTAVGTGVIGTTLAIQGDATFNTHGTWTATIVLQRNEDGTNWETFRTYTSANSRNVQLSFTEENQGVLYRMNVTSWTSGTINADLAITDSTQKGYAKVTAYASTTSVTATVVDDFASTDASLRWAEGSWSAERGYPKTFTFFEERGIYAATNDSSDPQTVWFSETDDYEDFYAGVNDADSFSVTISSDQRNAIQWIGAMDALVIGTTGGEWVIQSTLTGDPITPTDFRIRLQSSFGSTELQALPVNNALLFVDRAKRKLREFIYTNTATSKGYKAPNLMALAEHITLGGITSIALQRNPEQILWMTLASSPYLISLSYDRDQDVVAAAKHPFGGSGVVESVAVISGSEEDEVWLSVLVGTARHIVQMQPWNWGTDDDDAFFVDSGVTYSGASATAMTGLDHLDDLTVQTYGNGVKITDETVSSGAITLDTAVTKAQTGLSYSYELKPMKMDVQAQGDTTRGSKKKITEFVLSFKDTLNANYGNGTTTYSLKWPRTSVFEAIPLYTGDLTVGADGGFSEDIVISGSDPMPCTVLAIVARMEKIGR